MVIRATAGQGHLIMFHFEIRCVFCYKVSPSPMQYNTPSLLPHLLSTPIIPHDSTNTPPLLVSLCTLSSKLSRHVAQSSAHNVMGTVGKHLGKNGDACVVVSFSKKRLKILRFQNSFLFGYTSTFAKHGLVVSN